MGVGQELAVLIAFGIEGAMIKGGLQGGPLAQEFFGARREIMRYQLLPDVLDGLGCGVEHVLAVEAVVAQFVHHDFVGREVGLVDCGWWMVGGDYFVDGKEKGCLG